MRNLILKHKSCVLRLYSRFKNMNKPFDTKTPVFIDLKLAELITNYCHSKVE